MTKFICDVILNSQSGSPVVILNSQSGSPVVISNSQSGSPVVISNSQSGWRDLKISHFVRNDILEITFQLVVGCGWLMVNGEW